MRVASGGGPGSTAEFSVEAHLFPLVRELYRFGAGRWHVTDKSTLPSRIFFEFSLCPQTLKRTVIAVLPSLTSSLRKGSVTVMMFVTHMSFSCAYNAPTLWVSRWKSRLTTDYGTGRATMLLKLILLRLSLAICDPGRSPDIP